METGLTRMWTVLSSSSKGRLMVAAKDIPIGTVVLVEFPTVYVPYQIVGYSGTVGFDSSYSRAEESMLAAGTAATGTTFKGYAIILAARLVTASQRNASIRASIASLCRKSSDSSVSDFSDVIASAHIVRRLLLGSGVDCSLEGCVETLQKLECNAFTVVVRDLSSTVGIGLYTTAAAMNHSCDPNCCQTFDLSSSSKLFIRAIRNIQKGEEITISYIDVGKPTWWRKNELFLSYGFSCSCPRCGTLDPSDSYNCPVLNCHGVLGVIESDCYLSWKSSHVTCYSDLKMKQMIRSELELPFPIGDILLQSSSSTTNSSSSSSSSLSSPSSSSPTPSPLTTSPSKQNRTEGLNSSTKLRFLCNRCGNESGGDDIMKLICTLNKKIKRIKIKKINKNNVDSCVAESQDCIQSLLRLVKPSHYCMIDLYRDYVLEDLLLEGKFELYVRTVRSSNYLLNLKTKYPVNHPFPAIQAVMYAKSLLHIYQSNDDVVEVRACLLRALKVLTITHGEDASLVFDIKDMLSGISS